MKKRYILFLLIAGGLTAAMAQPCITYVASDLPKNIPESGGTSGTTTSTINIPFSDNIGSDVTLDQVQIDLDHTFDGDLDISLVSPANTSLILSDQNGGSGDDYENTRFRDDAAGTIDDLSASAPFNGIFLPEGGTFAGAFGGESTLGNWTLEIVDNLAGDGGDLFTFSITFCPLCPSDVTPPIARCRDRMLILNTNGQANIDPAFIDNGSSDNCELASLSVSRILFTCDDVRPAIRRRPSIVPVTLTATDLQGNSSQCVSRVEVKDLTPPNMNCRNITIELPQENRYNLQPWEVDDGSVDACGLELSLNQDRFDCDDLGVNEVQLTGQDASGNSAACFAQVQVLAGESSCPSPLASIRPPAFHEGLLLFPNPTAGELNLMLPATASPSQLTIQDQLGRTVWTRAVDAEQSQLQLELGPERFPPGLYFVHWQEAGVSPLVERLLVVR